MYNDWRREPFYGGCRYISEALGAVVEGEYSYSDPIEFEADCSSWSASNVPSQTFETADAAMAAAEEAAAG